MRFSLLLVVISFSTLLFSCQKEITQTINSPVSPTQNDYFPLTLNSNWIYSSLDISGAGTTSIDTVKVLSNGIFSGQAYTGLSSTWYQFTNNLADTIANYRRSGSDYYNYANFAEIFAFNNPLYGEYIFLKDNVPQNTSWQSRYFIGYFGVSTVPDTGYIVMTVLAKGVPATVGSLSFPDVIKIKEDYYLTPNRIVPFATGEIWYANHVGRISISDSFTISTLKRYTIY